MNCTGDNTFILASLYDSLWLSLVIHRIFVTLHSVSFT